MTDDFGHGEPDPANPLRDLAGRPVDRVHLAPGEPGAGRPPLVLAEGPDGFRSFPDNAGTANARLMLEQKARGGVLRGTIAIDGLSWRFQTTVVARGCHHALRRIGREPPPPQALGMPPAMLGQLVTARRVSSGLILVAGDAGSGKTTTVSSLYAAALRRDALIGVTIEDPPEYDLGGGLCWPGGSPPGREAGTRSWSIQGEPPGGDWAEGIAAAQRSDAQAILIGEVRDPACAAAAISAAIAGPLVLTSIHGADLNQAVERLVRFAAAAGMGDALARDQVSRCLAAAIHQRRRRGPGLAPGPTVSFTALFCEGELETAIRSKIRAGSPLHDEIRAQPLRMGR